MGIIPMKILGTYDIKIAPKQPPEIEPPPIAGLEQETARDDTLGTDQTMRNSSRVRQP